MEVEAAIQPALRAIGEELARPEGFEPPAPRFVVWCSIQLSYGRAGGCDIGAGAKPRNPRQHRRRPVLPGRPAPPRELA